jgi:plastocyanin
MPEIFEIAGLVREKESGLGLEGLVVRAYDKDLVHDDLMGEAVTACDGAFRIVSQAGDFRDFFERKPDIYLRVLAPGNGGAAPKELYSTGNAVRWNAGHAEYFVLEIPRRAAGDLPSGKPGKPDSSHSHPGQQQPGPVHPEPERPDQSRPPTPCGHPHHKPQPLTPITKCRHIYLKIEKLPAYSPVAPDDAEHDRYRTDCLRGMGHEDTRIPESEVERRRLDAVVYREYLDCDYKVMKKDPIIAADINEPRAERRIPGAVIYTQPGERLFIHVCNGDDHPHSLHVHGLVYGIDSDGSWPFGVVDASGRRSDAICPGQTWTYIFNVTEETVGAWPFHDHHMHIEENTNLGLFGGIVVRDPRCPKPDYEAPLFFHRLSPKRQEAGFDSGTVNAGDLFSHTFALEGTYDYYCRFHPMTGVVRVTAGGPAAANVNILDGPSRFDPADVTIGPGGTVNWNHAGAEPHTVTDAGGAGLASYALNGRTFVGNTPTIVARSGKRIRWYLFNLDLSAMWHNFHVHSQVWRVGDELMDTRSLGPAESFVADTIVPPVILLPLGNDCRSHQDDRKDKECGCGERVGRRRTQIPVRPELIHPGRPIHGGGPVPGFHGPAPAAPHLARHEDARPSKPEPDRPEGKPRRVKLRGDFLVHCHVEMHMMEGMAAVVRAVQEIEITPELEAALGFNPPEEDGSVCPAVSLHPCVHGGSGSWERLPDAPIFVVHAAVLNTGRVLLWAGTAEVGDPLESRVWNPADGSMTTQHYTVDLFCSGHAFLADGRLCVAGGAPSGILKATHLFDPGAETWTRVADMAEARWYPTVLTLPDGRILAASGSGASQLEIYDPAADTWQIVAGAGRIFPELYPSLHLLPAGRVFYSRVGWAQADMVQVQTAHLNFTGLAAGTWTDLGTQQFHNRQEGMALLQIDTTVSPPTARVTVMGGGVFGAAASRNPQSAEMINLTSLGGAAWTRLADMNFPRINVNAVLLPDGTILVLGGQRNGKWNADPGAVLEGEIYDPDTNTWTPTAPMEFPRQYHSIAVLLPDGRVLTAGGVDPRPAIVNRDQRSMELFSPPYLSMGPRPVITTAPGTAGYGTSFDIDSPDASRIGSVVLLTPGSVTHHTDAGLRHIKIPILSRTAAQLTVQAPADGNVAPPGFYMLFLVDLDRIPSIAHFIRIN